MTQALYAHMNNEKKIHPEGKKKIKMVKETNGISLINM
jgi:hypothetical protein